MRPSRLLAAPLAIGVALVLTSCGTGFDAMTETQGPSGNGTYLEVGDLLVQNLTIVMGPEGSDAAVLVGTVVNTGDIDDAIVSATIKDPAPGSTVITDDSIALAARSAVRFGYESDHAIDFYDFTPTISTYVTLTLGFEEAGQVSAQVIVVPPVGYYEGITPAPEPTLAPTPTPTPSAS